MRTIVQAELQPLRSAPARAGRGQQTVARDPLQVSVDRARSGCGFTRL